MKGIVRKQFNIRQIHIINEVWVVSVEFARERFNKTVKVDDLVYALEEMGYSVSLQKDSSLTDKKRRFATKKLFSEPEVIDQLRCAKANRDPDFTAYTGNPEEFAKLVEEVNTNQE